MKPHDIVILIKEIPEKDLKQGSVGTLVHVYEDGHGCEVEFQHNTGNGWKVVTLTFDDISAA